MTLSLFGLQWELISGRRIKPVRLDNAKELILGIMGNDFKQRGISVQNVMPYAHPQNGKAERYIRTLSDDSQALIADAKLPPSFWGDAILAAQYLRNRMPSKTTPDGITPFEAFHGRKPDLSHLRVFGCQAFVLIPPELRTMGGPRRFEGVFVGYMDNRVGWIVRDTNGKYRYSRDVVFNELVPGHLAPRRSISFSDSSSNVNSSPLSMPADIPADPSVSTVKPPSNDFYMVLRNRSKRIAVFSNSPPPPIASASSIDDFVFLNTLNDFLLPGSFSFTAENMPSFSFDANFTGKLRRRPRSAFRQTHDYDLSKPPSSYEEATSHPDSAICIAAMKREIESLLARGAFKPIFLPDGRKAIGLIWVFDFKYDTEGKPIPGKEKARLVAQGFSQRPEDYDGTYAPVSKLVSDRILLAYAAHHDFEIFFFDVKTAFLHAKLSKDIYVHQIPGFPLPDRTQVLRFLVALYGLRQSAHEFYHLLRNILLRMGFIVCDVDHAVFIGRWSSPPNSSISMPSDGSPLILIISCAALYLWFISCISKELEVVDLGVASMYLGMRIRRDRARRKLWLSQEPFIVDFLSNWDMLNVHPRNVPLSSLPDKFPPPNDNSLSDVKDSDVTLFFQIIVGSLQYLAMCTRPDIAYAAVALGQFNANPTRTHLLAAKGVLRYLSGTASYALEYSVEPSSFQFLSHHLSTLAPSLTVTGLLTVQIVEVFPVMLFIIMALLYHGAPTNKSPSPLLPRKPNIIPYHMQPVKHFGCVSTSHHYNSTSRDHFHSSATIKALSPSQMTLAM
ncbi:hypothetical protein CVT24_012432 [Panaeolus cyanescens]|uniref:Integrase catalytic domain-containing protein n=1 Tax=Panaeolus cyanescens TaxID=181874 RepID=A0A409YJ80_9AGAR|nr:hypothetical protein CVT24_012432 [Panaeolus cyanescens]